MFVCLFTCLLTDLFLKMYSLFLFVPSLFFFLFFVSPLGLALIVHEIFNNYIADKVHRWDGVRIYFFFLKRGGVVKRIS